MPRAPMNIRNLLHREQRMLSTTRSQLRPLFSTAEAMADLYNVVANAAVEKLPKATEDRVDQATSASLFIRSARRMAMLEFLDLARRHWPESLLLRRRAMELMAYAWKCWIGPKLTHNVVLPECELPSATVRWRHGLTSSWKTRILPALSCDPTSRSRVHDRILSPLLPSRPGRCAILRRVRLDRGR